ncbi:2TM domain-containing protein [Chryseobacterium binzhouense]|uniref:2TM domain-containing protein n=1 Tax=Chryseobacterium binzhouense TaxID=2593646 RepID=UPI002899D3B4|nr:2TM domain-containing protein [Chryseobacterium binzhouense]
MENNIQRSMRYREAEKKVKKIKGFYIHLMVYFFVNIFIIFSEAITAKPGAKFWEWDLLILPSLWGIGVAAHGLSVFLPAFILGKNWEEKKIRELMEKNK